MITQKELKEIFNYDEKTGVVVNRVKRGRAEKDKEAGSIMSNGYRYIMIDQKRYLTHRLAWLYVHGYMSENMIDHIDRNPLNNQINNLREVSRQCNMRNSSDSRNNKSGVKGIIWDKNTNKWRARIMVDKKNIHLGSYTDFDNAVCARLAGEQCVGWDKCDSNSSAYQYVKKMFERI